MNRIGSVNVLSLDFINVHISQLLDFEQPKWRTMAYPTEQEGRGGGCKLGNEELYIE